MSSSTRSSVISMQTFEEVITVIKTHKHKRDCLLLLTHQFSLISQETLLSIFSQQYQQYTKQVHHRHRHSTVMQEYYEKYQSRNTRCDGNETLILEMADEVLLSSTLFARIILEEYIRRNDLIPTNVAVSNLVSQWIKCPHSIPDLQLQHQVSHCILGDVNYGPLAENQKHSVGYQYEFLLLERIKELDIPYLDERSLSSRGYDKTPDVKLEVPVAVNGHIINWIESKASFGDEVNHNKYLNEQFWSYINRFGSGLVVYWFGYIKELDVHLKQGIMLADSFPPKSSITFLAGQQLTILKQN